MGEVAEREKFLNIDLNKFVLYLKVEKKQINLKLLFKSKWQRFYLVLIALVVNEMLELGFGKVRRGILISNHYEDLVVLCKSIVGGKKGEHLESGALLHRIYQAWIKRLNNLERAMHFDIFGRKPHKLVNNTKFDCSLNETDLWESLFEHDGSNSNARLRFSVDKVGLGPKDVVIKYGKDDKDSGKSAWERFLENSKQKISDRNINRPIKLRPVKLKKKELVSSIEHSNEPKIQGLIFLRVNEQGYKEYKAEKDGSTMILIPMGDFSMGAGKHDNFANEDEKPIHKVFLNSYFIGKYPVTRYQFIRFYDNNKYSFSSIKNFYWTGDDNYPIVDISWFDAIAYCKWAAMRLPTEAEWEKAAKGIDDRMYPWWDKNPSKSYANFNNMLYGITPVGFYPKGVSPYGLLDMSGNVWEWCDDWYDKCYYSNSPRSNPKGPENGFERVVKGGSYYNSRIGIRTTYRCGYKPSYHNREIGFRVVLKL